MCAHAQVCKLWVFSVGHTRQALCYIHILLNWDISPATSALTLKFMGTTEDSFSYANVLLMLCCLDKRLNHKIYRLNRLFWCSVPPAALLSVDTVLHSRSLGLIHLSEGL